MSMAPIRVALMCEVTLGVSMAARSQGLLIAGSALGRR
jgi:hypothetical protein